jgi:hypothetical protein
MIPVLEFGLDGGRGFGSEEDLLGQLVEAACSRPLLTRRRGKQERADKSRPKSARQPQHFSFLQKILFLAVFGIRDSLVRIRMRVQVFSSVTFKTLTKILFFSKFLCLFLFECTFTSFFKDKKS